MLSTTVLVLATVLILHHPEFANSDRSPCVNPRGDSGVCQKLTTCEPLRQLLLRYGNAVSKFLRQSVCTDDVKDLHVCCPTTISNHNRRPNNNNHNKNTNNNNTNTNNNNNINTNNNNNTNTNNDNKTNTDINNNTSNNNINPVTSSYGPLLPPACGTADARYTRVVGGVPARLGQWPWITALGYRGLQNPNKPRWLCGGSLISARHVLTAAHCIYRRNDLFVVRIGDLDLNSNADGAAPIDVPIERRTMHPQYTPDLYANDIAVLKLRLDIQFTSLIRPICLPVTDSIRQRNLVGTFPFLIGWGTIYYNGPSRPQLQQTQVPIVPQEQCRMAYRNYSTIAIIDDRVICAGYAQGGRDACQGDSGGPLMFPIGKIFYAIGVVAYGLRCARPGFPGVYSNTTTFLDFIIPLLN